MENKPDDFLKQFARDYHAGHIFTSGMVNNEHDMGLIFMPLLLADQETRNSFKGAQLVYEYYSKALPRGVNGQPMFMSCGFLTADDCQKVQVYVEKLRKAEEDALAD